MLPPRRLLYPFTVFFIGLVASLIAAFTVNQAENARRKARFDALAGSIVATLDGRLEEQRLLLRGVAGLIRASEYVSPQEFSQYVSQLRLPKYQPGVLGVGYARKLDDPAAVSSLVATMKEAGEPTFRVWPAPTRFPVSAIVYLEPQSAANRNAIGFDMYGEPVRHEAMARALRTGEAALSRKVKLVQDVGVTGNTAGFLLYVPVSPSAGADPRSRASEEIGWAYSPLRARELFSAALNRRDLAQAAVSIYDGSPTNPNLLFSTGDTPKEAKLRSVRTMRFAGRTWTIAVTALPGFFATSFLPTSLLVLLGGTLITLLLTLLMLQQVCATERTRAEVAQATANLRVANQALLSAAEARDAAEAQIRQMQKMEAIGRLTGGIAHDFNNMLAIIIGNLDLAQRYLHAPERVRSAMALAQEGAARAAELTRRLLAFARQQPLEPRVLDANGLVSRMSELLHRTLGEQIRLQTTLAAGLWPVEVDPGQLENALLNLAINARDAMPTGGILTIETANCHLDESHAKSAGDVVPGDYVMIAVRDLGVGMSRDILSKVLDPFFTTKETGSGLGLSQVYGFVKQSGGHLNIHSEVGQGTTVKIYLRRSFGRVISEPGREAERDLPRGHPQELIVVVEDQDGVRATTVDMLQELGYAVEQARDGQEALQVLAEKDGATLLLTDVVMPGMNGRELADRATALFPGLRVLFTTGYTRNAIVRDGRLDPNVQLITKPFTGIQLAKKVRAILDAS